MNFTYGSYKQLIQTLKKSGYNFTDYDKCDCFDKCVIMRHDLDFELQRALNIAEIEKEEGVFSTFFVLVTSDFYNILSSESAILVLSLSIFPQYAPILRLDSLQKTTYPFSFCIFIKSIVP